MEQSIQEDKPINGALVPAQAYRPEGAEFVEASDVSLASIVIAQPTQITALARKIPNISEGAVFNAETGEIVAVESQCFEMILVNKRKMWREYTDDKNNERVATYPWTEQNAHTEMKPGIKRIFYIYWAAILIPEGKQITRQGVANDIFPVIMPLKASGLRFHSKGISTTLAKTLSAKVSIYNIVFNVKTVRADDPQYNYLVYTLDGTRVTTPSEADVGQFWYKQLGGQARVTDAPASQQTTEAPNVADTSMDDVPF